MKAVLPEYNSALLKEFKGGKESAFDKLFNLMFPPLCLFAERIVEELPLAEDLVQDSFVQAWQRRVDFENFDHLRAFLYTCVKNAALNSLARQKVQRKFQEQFDLDQYIHNYNPLADIIYSELVTRVFAQVDTLPEQCRKIIRMTFELEMSPREIAEELGLSVSTINSQKMRGLNILKSKLSPDEYLCVVFVFFVSGK